MAAAVVTGLVRSARVSLHHACFGLLALAASLATPTAASALDCTKAASPIELATCASPALMEQDTALGKAYADRLAQDPTRAPLLRTEQRAWLTQRDRLCGANAASAPKMMSCLTGLYRTRLLALGAGSAARPAQATLPLAAVLSAPPAVPLPALPTSRPGPEAVLSRSAVPAAGRGDALLDVRVPGRFSLRATSSSGVALQLIDMIAGPGDEVGAPGTKDGRTDVLLDRGTYKVRSFGAAGATGEARLTVQPFREGGDIDNRLSFGGEAETTLSDLGQRSFWLVVRAPGHVAVEAVGRSLGDLRLWRNGTDLSEIMPAIGRITPKPGHPMTRARIEGDVEPGVYLATAYGGQKLVWADGEATEPLHVRAGEPERLAGGWVEGVIGALGTARFTAPDRATSILLELPEPAPATLTIRHGGDTPSTESIFKNSREPVARVDSPAGASRLVEVAGLEGQPYRLRALDPSASRDVVGAGPQWIGVDVAGEGGDEFPATVVLAQFRGDRGRVLASNAPQIGPATAWRQKVNLRGRSTLLFEVKATLQVGVTVAGVRAEPSIAPLLGTAPPRADGKTPQWTLEPGWYVLTLVPATDAAGIADITLGPPGLTGDLKPQPARPSIALGIQTLERGGHYQILTNEAPGLVLAPYARALPADLETEPFALSQAAGQALDVPVRAPAHGYLAATAVNGVPVAVQRGAAVSAKDAQTVTLHIPAPERARGLLLSWSDPRDNEAAGVSLPDAGNLEGVTAGKARFFDLGRDETRSFALDVPEGGLYRVETLGRLHTSLAVATAFLPTLDSASANGAGENALALSYLRAGHYTVAVKASDSGGRAGLVARPAALAAMEPLVADGSSRASLNDGQGAVFPIEIDEPGRYRLDLYSLGQPLRARLEDQDGWPLTVPGPTAAIERQFDAGRYRLVVLPEPVDVRAVVRLTRLVSPPVVTGHGPHVLPFDAATTFQWREPASAGETRSPDRWEFVLQGPASVTLDLSGGMIGTLVRDGDSTSVGRIVAKSGFSGRLDAGRYAVEAQSLGRNDRLDYTLTLRAAEIQPGVTRHIELPATVPFALAEDRVVSLTSFGRTDLRGILKDSTGTVVERADGRTDDWNIALSRWLPAGAYTLELSSADPRAAKKEKADDADEPDSSAGPDQPDTPADDKNADTTPDDADQPAVAGMAGDQPDADAEPDADKDAADTPDSPDQPDGDKKDASDDTPATADAADQEKDKPTAAKAADTTDAETDATGVELRLALPVTVDGPSLASEGETAVTGGEVHRFALPAIPAGQLMMIAAHAGQDLVLSLERGDAKGQWTVVGSERGKAPLAAAPSDGDARRPWRASVWAIDGGPATIHLAVRAATRSAADGRTIALDPVAFGEGAPDVRVALVAAPASGLLSLQSGLEGLSEGSLAGHLLQPVTDRTLVPQADATWIVAREPARDTLTVAPATLPESGLAFTVPAGGRATIPPLAPTAGQVRMWRADSTFGQPGLSGGHGFGVVQGSAAGLAGDGPVTVWNAGGSDRLPVRASVTTLSLRPAARTDDDLAIALPQGSAQPIALPAGRKRLTVDLAAGTAAVLDAVDRPSTTIWAGEVAQSRTLDGTWSTILVANLAADSRPVRISVAPLEEEPVALVAGRAAKRFFGAAGSTSMRVEAAPGDTLVAAGAQATFVADDGRVERTLPIALTGGGDLVLDHPPGLVAAWIEKPGLSPWPEAKAQPVALPAVVALEGQAQALALTAPSAVLLHVRSSAPVILALSQPGRRGDPVIFPAGAVFDRLLTAGEAILRLYSPHDGPLSGTLEVTGSPVTPASEGVGEPVALAPGASTLFAFDVARRAPIGVGLRAEPDMIAARLLDATGRSLGTGVAQLQTLDPGRYLLEASVPVDGRTTVVRPAVVGLRPPPSGPPQDVVHDYLQLVGLAPTAPTVESRMP